MPAVEGIEGHQVEHRYEDVDQSQQYEAVLNRSCDLYEPDGAHWACCVGGIDVGTEKTFITRLAPTLKGRTLILVTHRASLLPLVERIIILDQGRVVADGPREKVLEALNSGKIKVDQA